MFLIAKMNFKDIKHRKIAQKKCSRNLSLKKESCNSDIIYV